MRTGVAIALYNGMRFLKEQIDSLLAQTMKPDIIVCCDDGSTDGSLEWIAEYSAAHGESDRFLLVRNEERLGYIQNFYKALDLCDADLLFLCDQDDIWDRTKIERMAAEFSANPQWSLISCAHTLIDAVGQQISSIRYSQKSGDGVISSVAERDVITFFRWPGMTMAMRREFWDTNKASAKSIDAPHDRVLGLLAASNHTMGYLDAALCAHRLHTSNSGGEEDNLKTVLGRDFKIKELGTSLKWLNAQLDHQECFSGAAQKELSGYRDYVALRLKAVEKRSFISLLSAVMHCRRYLNPKGILSDAASIILHK